MNTEPIVPRLPFVWPEPRVSAGAGRYGFHPPFESVVQSAQAVFGIVSAIDAHAISWLEGLLADHKSVKLRLVVSLYPTCRTTEANLQQLMRVTERHGGRAAFKVYPEESLTSRSSNLLCLHGTDGSLSIAVGPTENLGFAPTSASHANLAIQVSASAFEACRNWFDYLWGVAGPLKPSLALTMPRLVLPQGDIEASRLWSAFRNQCLQANSPDQTAVAPAVDLETGKVELKTIEGDPVASPTDELKVPRLDELAENIARVFELGLLVSIDKQSRIPPLEAPVKPEWFGVESFRQTGMVRSQTSIKVSPFDETTLKKIERLRRASGELLPRYSFALADGVRWIPRQAIALFESALTAANTDAKKLFGDEVGDNIEDFLQSQRSRIRADAQRMYVGFHPGGLIPESAVTHILEELKSRLDRTGADKIIPRVAYSPVSFNPSHSSDWASPWGQAFTLLKGIAEFPRRVMTDRFFLQGIRTDEDALVDAMDVAGDYLVKDYGNRKAREQAAIDLGLIKHLDEAATDAQRKCNALWTLIKTGQYGDAVALLNEAPASADNRHNGR